MQAPVQHIPGGLGVVSLVTEGNHCLHIVLGPFAGCESMLDIAQRLYGLEDVILMGITVATVILISSIGGIVYSGIRLIRSLVYAIRMARSARNGAWPINPAAENADADLGAV